MTNGSLMKVESIAECSPWICIKGDGNPDDYYILYERS